MSGLSDGASAAAVGLSPSERALMHAYRVAAPIEVQQDCSCGGVIRATMGDWGGIATAIRCHQELTIHRMWREAWGDRLCPPMASRRPTPSDARSRKANRRGR